MKTTQMLLRLFKEYESINDERIINIQSMIKDFDEYKRLLIDFMIINNNERLGQLNDKHKEEQMKNVFYLQKKLKYAFDALNDKDEDL